MINEHAQYTYLYKDYIEAYGTPTALTLIPSITIGNHTFEFTKMFYDRFKYREICCESTTYFTDLANRVITEAALIFNNNIKGFEQNLSNLWQKEITEENKSYSNYYYNPMVSANTGDPKLQSTSESIYPHHITYNAGNIFEMVKGATEMQNIFYECLKYCEKLFFALY